MINSGMGVSCFQTKKMVLLLRHHRPIVPPGLDLDFGPALAWTIVEPSKTHGKPTQPPYKYHHINTQQSETV